MTKDEQIALLKAALRFYTDAQSDAPTLVISTICGGGWGRDYVADERGHRAREALAAVEAPPPADKYSDMIAGALKAYELLPPELRAPHTRKQRRSFLRGMCPSHWDYEAWCGHVDKWCDENGY